MGSSGEPASLSDASAHLRASMESQSRLSRGSLRSRWVLRWVESSGTLVRTMRVHHVGQVLNGSKAPNLRILVKCSRRIREHDVWGGYLKLSDVACEACSQSGSEEGRGAGGRV